MKSLASLSKDRFRTTFFVFYALSSLIPTLLVLFVIVYYVRPVLYPNQVEKLKDIASYTLSAMLIIPFLGLGVMAWWVNSLERLTEHLKTKSAELLGERVVISERNEITTLHRHFDGLFGELQGKIADLNEVSKQLVESKKKMSQMAVTDDLTSLFNRRYFDRRLVEEIAKAQKRKAPLALIMIDINNFKKYNENYGHQAGDELLKTMGHMIRENTAKPDAPFRYGGDEFAIIVPGASTEDAAAKAQKLVEAASHLHVHGSREGETVKVSISCGVISYSQGLESLPMEADRCLNEALSSGRGRVALLTPRPTPYS